jgi:hypothetical protein
VLNIDCEEAEVLCSFDRRVGIDAKHLDGDDTTNSDMQANNNEQKWDHASLHTTKLKFVSDLELMPLRCSAGRSNLV